MRKRRNTVRFATKARMARRKAASKKGRSTSGMKKGKKAYAFVIPSNTSLTSNDQRPEGDIRQDASSYDRESSRQPMLSVIIPAMNEERTIAAVVREASRICHDAEMLVIVNGSTDGTAKAAERAGARVVYFREALGHDRGRRIGAEVARGRVILFTDADIPIAAEHLAPYVEAVLKGTDVALNDYDGPVTRNPVHPVVEAKHMLNSLLSRSDLGGASMTAIPHAISRKALDVIGCSSLEIPPLAQVKAVVAGLRVHAVHHVPVGKMNAVRMKKRKGPDPLSQVVLNDHLAAIRWLTDTLGSRGGFPDLGRVRSLTR